MGSVHAAVLVMPKTLYLVLEQQFTPFEFNNFQIIDRGMGLAIADPIADGPVLLLKFRKMRLHRHTECLLNLLVSDGVFVSFDIARWLERTLRN